MFLSKTLPFFFTCKRFTVFFLLQFFVIFSFAQFSDNFSEDLSNWEGDIGHFTINGEEQLQLNAPEAGNSILYTPVVLPDSLFWEVSFRMLFAPSNNNNLRIYLQADDGDLTFSDGYFLQIGENLSEDAVQLWRSDGGTGTLLATATLGAVSTNPAQAKLRIERDSDGTWRLYVSYSMGNDFNLEFTTQDDTYGSGDNLFFGFSCKYTGGNVTKFIFDNILIDELLPDIEPPILVSATTISATELDIAFNENIDATSANNVANYTINNGVGIPVLASLDASNSSLVHLSLSTPLTNADNYILTTNNISDLEENESSQQTAAFSFFQPDEAAPLDVLINEIMADPNPPVGLPISEYIELYNRSDKVIDLENFGFANSQTATPKLLPSYILQPNSYVILTDNEDLDSLSEYGDVIILGTLPSLSNGGAELLLTDPFGDLIHYVNYDIDWYNDSAKEDGGYSLELISPFNICEGQNNWRATNNAEGGTPGVQNSIFNPIPDETRPDLLRGYVSANNPSQIKLYFSEILDNATAEDPDNYIIDNDVQIANISLAFPQRKKVLINLTSPLELGVIYKIKARNDLLDCNGNAIGMFNETTVSVPEPIEPKDILINEILFNPEPNGADFLELYNKTNKTFDLSELVIRNAILRKDILGNDSLAGTAVSINTEFLFPPKSYLTLTPNRVDILARYTVQNTAWLLEIPLPSFGNEKGFVKITTGEDLETIYIDSVNYLTDWHHALLDDEEGVSLERIDINATSDDAGNWHSAAGTANFGTPTAPNSQSIEAITPTGDMFTLVNSTFSPDDDGYKDFVQINYQSDQNGYIANAKIFDANGRLITRLLENELLGATGTFKWDGVTDLGKKARIGIYILWIEVFRPDGGRMLQKMAIVVGGEF